MRTRVLGLSFGLALSWLIVCAGIAGAVEPSTEQRLLQLSEQTNRELTANILPFWLKYAPDESTGGFQGQVDNRLRADPSVPRGALLTSRILWTFSAAYSRVQGERPEYLAMAKRAAADLLNRFWDQQHGGFFWTVDVQGKPENTTKQIYGQAFGVFALSEYYRVTHDEAALKRAQELYRLLETHAKDAKHGGYFEIFARDWTAERQSKSFVSPKAAKSQNTHLHIMEAYTSLARVWPDAELKSSLRAIVELMLTKIYDPRTKHLQLFLTDDWKPLSETYSYGHDIEAAWLLNEADGVLGEAELSKRVRETALNLAEETLASGIDRDGGVFNEGNRRGPTLRTKDWWPQAEAVVGFLDAYGLSRDSRFLNAAEKTWSFIQAKFADHAGGEWFQSLDDRGAVVTHPKISLWKCPYHNGRACLEATERAARLLRPRAAN
ncbi:MAG: AGE family epimerase/isomerase [Nibricoccus sp.]